MRTDEAILDETIKDGSVEVDEWPELLKRLLQRLDHIAHNSFPQPALPSPSEEIFTTAPSTQVPPTLSTESTLTSSPDESSTALELPSAPSQDNDAPSPMPPPLPSAPSPPPGTLPPDSAALLTTLTTTLTTQFSIAPPYTIQRLAELLRSPTAHYRSLPKYLRALHRVLSVSSPTTAFPLPPSVIPNGSAFTLGSDESLGGALLSPIPWLTPSALTEDDDSVSQGELMRHEQELGVVPAVQGDEPHTGGAPPLGPEDVGPQPEGTVFPDVPATLEEARSPLVVVGDTMMGEVGEGEGEKEKEEKEEEDKKDDMEVDGKEEKEKEKEKELEDKMQLDAASDGKAEAEAEALKGADS